MFLADDVVHHLGDVLNIRRSKGVVKFTVALCIGHQLLKKGCSFLLLLLPVRLLENKLPAFIVEISITKKKDVNKLIR